MSPHALFFFNDPATTEIYTLSLHDALPIFSKVPGTSTTGWGRAAVGRQDQSLAPGGDTTGRDASGGDTTGRDASGWAAEAEIGRAHSELQSRQYLVCRLLLEKKKYLMYSTM